MVILGIVIAFLNLFFGLVTGIASEQFCPPQSKNIGRFMGILFIVTSAFLFVSLARG